jgi:hypothetical protein
MGAVIFVSAEEARVTGCRATDFIQKRKLSFDLEDLMSDRMFDSPVS